MNSNQFELVGLVAGTKFWSLQLDFEAVHTMPLFPATSCRDQSQGLVAGTSPIVCATFIDWGVMSGVCNSCSSIVFQVDLESTSLLI